jgi:hypothetical protein
MRKRYQHFGDSLDRYRKLDLLNLSEVEQEIDSLIALAGDDPDWETIEEVSGLIKVAKALGTKRSW